MIEAPRLSKPVAEFLESRGFELLGQNPDLRREFLYLRQTSVRHVMISIPDDAGTDDVIDAIYDAGRESTRAHINQRFNDLLLSMRVLSLPPLIPPPKTSPSKT